MKRYLFLLAACCTLTGIQAQKKNFSYKFYGQVRADLFYNSRANAETVDGLFYMYPKDHAYDAAGEDLNATPNGSFYLLYTRLGVDIAGPRVGKAATTVKIEADFRGSGSTYALLRIRHAYVNLDWGKSAVLIGQTWHPLFGDVSPDILNLSVGAPFQPFNRSPLIRYRYRNNGWQLTGAAIWQLQYQSAGPAASGGTEKSEAFIKNSCVPEFYVGADYKTGGFTAGAGVELLSLKPRTQATEYNRVYKVNERITTLSPEAHFKYSGNDWTVAGKTVLASNLTQCSMLGGFGVSDTYADHGEREYTTFRHSVSWLNIVYGKEWKPSIYLGYMKNMGTSKEIKGDIYGVGLDIDQLVMANAQLTYNRPHWRAGVEYSCSTALYGSLDRYSGHVEDTHSVTNHRVVGVFMYLF